MGGNCYTIQVYTSFGRTGYIRMSGNGNMNWSLVDDVGSARLFRTIDEAKDFYYRYIKNCYNSQTGEYIIGEKCTIVTCYDPTL